MIELPRLCCFAGLGGRNPAERIPARISRCVTTQSSWATRWFTGRRQAEAGIEACDDSTWKPGKESTAWKEAGMAEIKAR